MRINFDVCRTATKVSTFCTQCDKRLTRTVSDYQTVNPWNVTQAGEPKTRGQIYLELSRTVQDRADALRVSGAVCRACEVND
jgi:hypothetical protein